MPHKTPKRVHFEDYPAPGSPSPALTNTSLPFSSSSSSSSAGPRTPPDEQYASLPLFSTTHHLKQQKASLPSPAFSTLSFGSSAYTSGQVLIHPALAAGGALLPWNLIVPAASSYPSDLTAQPATHPALPEIEIVCDFLPWPITVRPIPSASWSPNTVQIVTVGDVLHTIYRMLRLAVSPPEFQSLPPDAQARVTMAFETRIAHIADPARRKDERAKGLKRVDFLMDARAFAGLSMATSSNALRGRGLGSVWVLNVAIAWP